MIARVFEHFERICEIPHCSCEAEALRDFLVGFAREKDYEVDVDEAGNILARRGEPRLCLQAHYDMVCVGRAPEIETLEEGGWLQAAESSLGADNGIAVAMIMALMEEGRELEFLFTADEEVGLVGAKALSFELKSPRLLNLDTEEEGVVYIGCAGGVDIVARMQSATRSVEGPFWKLSISGLLGGHSGVDIDKEIPNAIKVLAQHLAEEEELELLSFVGGERRNSIPTAAEAIIRCESRPKATDEIVVEAVEWEGTEALQHSRELIALLSTAPHGVVGMNEELKIPESSLNLALVELAPRGCRIDYSLRAMSAEGLEELAFRMEILLERYGFTTQRSEAYPPWKPRFGSFAKEVASILEDSFSKAEPKAIHAGLECGILSERYPDIEMASIGPTIENPHSIRERVEIASVKRTFDVLLKIVQSLGPGGKRQESRT